MKRTSLKLKIIAVLCLIALGGTVYAKIAPSLKIARTQAQKPDLQVARTQKTTTVNEIKRKIETPSNETAEGSVTESISKDFAGNYFDLTSQNNWNTDSQAGLIDSITQSYTSNTQKNLQLSDISTFSDKDTAKVHNFGNTTVTAIVNYYQTLKVSPLDMISASTQNTNGSTTLAAQLKPLSAAYRNMVLDLVKIQAPANLGADYLALINGYIHLADDIDDMSFYYADPARGFIGLNNYQNDLLDQANLLKNVASYFKTNGILYSTAEAGYMWSSLTL